MAEEAQATVSKREQKRQARLAKEKAEKVQVEGVEPVDPANGLILPILEVESGESASTLKSSPFIEPVQKRIRNYLKKKQKIDQLTERANDPEEYEKLNKDQLEQLARRDQVLAPLKELQNLAEQFTEIETEHSATQRSEAVATKQTNAAAIKEAREQGLTEGKKILSSLISFLGYASVLRANPTPETDFNDATERLLSLVYLGGDASLEAAINLDAASEDTIDDTAITFKQVHEAIFQKGDIAPQSAPEELPEVEETAKSPETSSQHYQGANFISLSEIASHPSSIGTGGISFLNESEIEGSHQRESVGTALTTEDEAAPSQTIAEEDGNKAAATLDWSAMNTPRTNWADEDSSETAMPESDPVAVPQPEAEETPEKSSLQPLSDFKTIEKKGPVREGGRGRGRGSGRGRGDRGGGRGRGEGRGAKPRPE